MPALDFLDLYKELGLGRGANLEEMKRAYRRRVSELHPDRHEAHVDPDARLQHLTALYARAMQFHRHHGRLPGAPTPHPATHAPAASDSRPRQPAPGSAPAAQSRRFRLRWLILAVLVAIGWLLLSPREPDVDPRSTTAPGGLSAARSAADEAGDTAAALRRARTLTLGMTPDEVAEIEGEPITRSGSRWDYGASWIAFDEDKVSDWYSSPMQPLKRASKHAPPPEPRRDEH